MLLQLLLMFLCFIVCKQYESWGDNERNRHKYMTFIIWVLILQSALRNLAVGSDTYSYYEDFVFTYEHRTWQVIWHNFYDVYVLGDGKDAGYWLLMKVFSSVCPNFLAYLFFVAIIFFYPLCRMVERHLYTLNQLLMFFCVYQVMFYSFFSITGIRQTIATVATFYGIAFIKERKFLKFVLVLLIASFIHKSVFLFLPFYFIARLPNSRSLLLMTMCALPLIFGIARPIASFLAIYSGSDYYMMYAESEMDTGGAASFLMFIVGSSILVFIAKTRRPNSIPDMVVHAMSLALVFTPMMWVDTSLMRVIQYYSIFCLISIPLAIDNIGHSRDLQKTLYWGFMIVLIITTIRHNYEYAFFWQDMAVNKTINHI